MKLQRGTSVIKLGPLSSLVVRGAVWFGLDEYPSFQFWADELEELLSFAQGSSVLDRYLPELRASRNQRDAALSELRVAFYFHKNRFPITRWKPVGRLPKEGEFCIACASGGEIFVEVKGPGWESELPKEERLAGRTKQPKYIDSEAKWVSSSEPIVMAVDKAYPKFSDATANLLVIADDLFVGYLERRSALQDLEAGLALYSCHNRGAFTNPSYERLGGVGIFAVAEKQGDISYNMRLFLNSFATKCALPQDFVAAFCGETLPIA